MLPRMNGAIWSSGFWAAPASAMSTDLESTFLRNFGTSRASIRVGMLAKVKIDLRTWSARALSVSSRPSRTSSRVPDWLALRIEPMTSAGPLSKATAGRWRSWS